MLNSGKHAAAGQMAWSLVGCKAVCAGMASHHFIRRLRSAASKLRKDCKVNCLQHCK